MSASVLSLAPPLDLASAGSGASSDRGDRVNGEEAQMVEMIRHCPDCGSDRQFGQLHPAQGTCPDSRDGYCPEWSCTACGTGLLIGFITFMYESPDIADPQARVA